MLITPGPPRVRGLSPAACTACTLHAAAAGMLSRARLHVGGVPPVHALQPRRARPHLRRSCCYRCARPLTSRRCSPLPATAHPPADYIMFTYNDWQSGQNSPPYPPASAFLRGIREAEWKIVMYYSPDGAKNASLTVEWVSARGSAGAERAVCMGGGRSGWCACPSPGAAAAPAATPHAGADAAAHGPCPSAPLICARRSATT